MIRDLLYTEDALQDTKTDNKKTSKLDAIRPPKRKVMTGVDYRHTSLHFDRGVGIDL